MDSTQPPTSPTTDPKQPGTRDGPQAGADAYIALLDRVRNLEERLQALEREQRRRVPEPPSPDLSLLARQLSRIADAIAAPDAAAKAKRKCVRPATGSVPSNGPDGLGLPEEVSTAQAAEILGVSKDTVLAYRERGLLPFRDLAPPGGSKPVYMFPLAAVLELRTAYQTEQPAPATPKEPTRRAKGQRKYKHLDLDD
jgi:hypothetical protein